jgi:CheY-like chemotaxis protein
MSPDVVSRVFEPFFTTKTGAGGTGLGLSMVYGFAKQSGGTVAVDSQPGHGTTVSIFLPLAQSEPRAVVAATTTRSVTVPRAILVVEDEPAVRNTVKRQLEGLGHRVSVCESAAEALHLVQQGHEIDVLLTDVVLGAGMNGIDLANAIRAVRPDLPLIFMSGYTAVPEAHQRIRATGAPLLAKPATMAQLQKALNEVTVTKA